LITLAARADEVIDSDALAALCMSPIGQLRTDAPHQKEPIFDHAVGTQQQRRWIAGPIVFAVRKLTTSSNVVGCSMGRSLGAHRGGFVS